MNKLFSSFFAVIFLFVAVPAQAQVNFLLGTATGLMLGSSSSSDKSNHGQSAGDGANVLYLMPRAAERVTDPLEMKITASDTCVRDTFPTRSGVVCSRSIRGYFAETVSNAGKYEIIQAIRFSNPERPELVGIWFTYIEKTKVIALDKLPPLVQQEPEKKSASTKSEQKKK